MLSTPPAFVLSQDQTLRTKTIQKKPTTPQHGQPIPTKTTNSKTKNRHKNKHTIEFTNNTHTPQNSHKKPQPSKKGRKQPRHDHKPQTESKACNHPAQQQKQYPPHTKPSNQHKPHPHPLIHHQNRTISPKTGPDQQENSKTVICQRFADHKTRV